MGFGSPQAAPVGLVFGDVTSQTNGSSSTTTPSQDTSRPFGFGFGSARDDTQSLQDKNLFFQCMSQNSGSSPSVTASQSQPKDTNYFTAASENKDPPSLFKSATSAEVLKKPDQPKVPETHPTGNGVLNKSASPLQGVCTSTGERSSTVSIGGLTSTSGGQSTAKTSSNNGTTTGSLGLQSSFTSSDSHQNLFLQASKEPTNPFLAYGDKITHVPFAGLSGAEPQSVVSASDSQSNLFTMAEPPKGILPTSFPALSAVASVSSSSATLAPSLKPQSEEPETKDEEDGTSGSGIFGSAGPGGMEKDSLSFDPTQPQKFTLEERSQASKHDSDSSSNSDLSDLSENEDGLEKGQVPGGPHPPKDGAMLQKKGHGAKGRPRNKPFKGKTGPHVHIDCVCLSSKINTELFLSVGQSVLKDQSKVRRLKQSGESFLQDGSCINVAPHLHKCRECRLERYRKSRNAEGESDEENDPNVACRFFHFRRSASDAIGCDVAVYCHKAKSCSSYNSNSNHNFFPLFFCVFYQVGIHP